MKKTNEVTSIAENIENKTILVVDDQLMNCEMVGFILEETNVNVIFAGNGVEAIEQANSHSPDLILMDIQMPIMDGITACETLRKQAFDKPIIALTANVMADHIERYKTAGFDDHLGKPIDPDELLEHICHHLHRENRASF